MIPIEPVGDCSRPRRNAVAIESFGLLIAEARKVSSLGPAGHVRARATHAARCHRRTRDYARLLNEALVMTLEEE